MDSQDFQVVTPDEEDFLKTKPSDLKNFGNVFSEEEKAERERNISILTH